MAEKSNGVDLGAIYGAIIALSERMKKLDSEMGQVRGEIGQLRGEIGQIRGEVGQVRGEMTQLRSDVEQFRRDVRHDIDGLRQEVRDYHGSIIGHGVLISELDERVTRLEQQRRQ